MTTKRLNIHNVCATFIFAVFLMPFLLLKAAPVHEFTEIEQYTEGCYYNYHHYNEGDRIITNEPCLNCTCHNKMLMCYLRVCPFTKPISHECTVEKREDQCCPIITCPEVPVDIDQHYTELSYSLEMNEKFGCSVGGKLYPQGAQVPSNPNKPCELCYCIKNHTSCLMQECTLHIESCTPIYNRGSCCPVRYNCDHENDVLDMEDHSDSIAKYTTERTTPGFILTTTVLPQSFECIYNGISHTDGARIYRENSCENCYCMHGDIICAVQECNQPMLSDNGITCQALPSNGTECCPKNYICDQNSTITDIDRIETTTILSSHHEDSSKTFILVDKMHESISQDDLQLQTHIEIDEGESFQTELPLQIDAKLNEKVTRLIERNSTEKNKKLNIYRDNIEDFTKLYTHYPILYDDKFTMNAEKYTTASINEDYITQQSTTERSLHESNKNRNRSDTEKLFKEEKGTTTSIKLFNDNSKYYTITPSSYSTIEEEDNTIITTKEDISVSAEMNRTSANDLWKYQFLETTELPLISKTTTYDPYTFINEMDIDNNITKDAERSNGKFSSTEPQEIPTTITTDINMTILPNVNKSDTNENFHFELEYFDNEIAETSNIPENDLRINSHKNQDQINLKETIHSLNNKQYLTKSTDMETDLTTENYPSEGSESTQINQLNEYTTMIDIANGKKTKANGISKIPSGKKTFKIASFNSEILNEEIYFDAQTVTSTVSNDLIENFSENIEKYESSKTDDLIEDFEQTTVYIKPITDIPIIEDFTSTDVEEQKPFTINANLDISYNGPTYSMTQTTIPINDFKIDTYSTESITDNNLMEITSTITSENTEDKNDFEPFSDLNFKKFSLDFAKLESDNLYSTPIMADNESSTSKESFISSTKSNESNEQKADWELNKITKMATGFSKLLSLHKTQRQNEAEESLSTTESTLENGNTLYRTTEKDVISKSQDVIDKFIETSTTIISTEHEPINVVTTDGSIGETTINFIPNEIYPKEMENIHQNIYNELITKSIIKNEIYTSNVSTSFNGNLPHTIPGEGSCLIDEKTIENNSIIPTPKHCNISCRCLNSVVVCENVKCHMPDHFESCILSNTSFEDCCPLYICDTYEIDTTAQPKERLLQTTLFKINHTQDKEEALQSSNHTVSTNLPESTDLNYIDLFTEAIVPEVLFADYEEYPSANISLTKTKDKIFSSQQLVPSLNYSIIISSDDKKLQDYDLKSTNETDDLLLKESTSLSTPLPSFTSTFTMNSEEVYDKLVETSTDRPISIKYFIPNTLSTQFEKTDNPSEKKQSTEHDSLNLINSETFTTSYDMGPTTALYSTEKYFNQQLQTSTEDDNQSNINYESTEIIDKTFNGPLHLTTTEFDNDNDNDSNMSVYTTSIYDQGILNTSREEKEIISSTSSKAPIKMDETFKLDNKLYSYVTKSDEFDDLNNQNIELTTLSDNIPTVNDTIDQPNKNISKVLFTMEPDVELTTTSIIIIDNDVMEEQKQLNAFKNNEKGIPFTETSSNSFDQLAVATDTTKEINSIEFNNFDIKDSVNINVTESPFVTMASISTIETKPHTKTSNALVDLVDESTTVIPKKSTEENAVTIKTLTQIDLNSNYSLIPNKLSQHDETLKQKNNMTSLEHQYSIENSKASTTFSFITKMPDNTTDSTFWQMSHYDNFHTPEQISIPVEHIANESIYHITTTITPTQTTTPITMESSTIGKSTIATVPSYHASNNNYQPQMPNYAQPPQYPSYPDDDYTEEDEAEVFGPGTCRYGGKLYVSAQQIPRDDPCDFCFCFRSDIICLQQSCPPPISGCHEEPIIGFCCPRYECPISIGNGLNLTLESTTTSTTLTPNFPYFTNKHIQQRLGCMINGRSYNVGEKIESTSGPCINCLCGGDGNMKCNPQACVPEPTMQQVMAAVAAGRKR